MIGPSHVSGVGQRATRIIDVHIDGHTVEGPVSMAAEARTCSRTTTGRGQDSPASTALDVPTALMSSSGASTTPTAPDEHGAQTSRAQRGALAPGTIMGRTGYETTRPRARAFENYHGPSSSDRRGPGLGDPRSDVFKKREFYSAQSASRWSPASPANPQAQVPSRTSRWSPGMTDSTR